MRILCDEQSGNVRILESREERSFNRSIRIHYTNIFHRGEPSEQEQYTEGEQLAMYLEKESSKRRPPVQDPADVHVTTPT